MIELSNILNEERVSIKNDLGQTKKRVLQSISEHISSQCPELTENDIFDHSGTEKLGSTGFGNGVAMPHCRLEQCQQVIGSFFY